LEESPNEEVADNLILIERGQYVCEKMQRSHWRIQRVPKERRSW
ncbi:hypothetical protein AAA799D11_00671, partial [Marine Group I thaumarchaeote SCGC AAA799-D11]